MADGFIERQQRRREIAEQIVDDIMQNGQGDRAERLVLMLPGDVDGGGWSRDPLVDRVQKMLIACEVK